MWEYVYIYAGIITEGILIERAGNFSAEFLIDEADAPAAESEIQVP